ncbi:argonaute/piwi family protein [Rhodopirellula sp. P2]|uniref:argonaute/piwi family protein n=1 Tax=Rhodopirellula sp. P2 TaxID=2127060 RepID=UPI0023686BFA|nr:Piwi domain-containing protein [Rhodopirellula sp. P2]WDQ17039.1 Piwi domain-containing protein [Rhodopirellula sp. P2]
MNVTFIQEPELEFGTGQHIDIRYGLSTHGPLDQKSEFAPTKVRLGLIGDQNSINQFSKWIGKCRRGIAAKKTPLVTLFPAFPGFGDGKPLCDFVVSEQSSRPIIGREVRRLSSIKDRNELVTESVDYFLAEAADLLQSVACDVIICLPPEDLLKPIDAGSVAPGTPRSRRKSKTKEPHKSVWHDLLKARAMPMQVPIQMVRPATYGGKVHRFRQDGTSTKNVEDEASRAWNFYTALYYKAGGVPWRLVRNSSDLDTCFVGVSYFHPVNGDSVQASVAQVFNERGEGVVVRGGQALVEKDDRTLHMDVETAAGLLRNALSLYKKEHRNLPARVVCHKSSYFDDAEANGFQNVADELGVDQLDCVSLRKSSVRFFRNRPNPPLRGTAIELDQRTSILYTQGSVDFYRAYPGMHIPRPLEITFDHTERPADQLLHEMLSLTKMNWNSTRFVNAEPITVAAARNVGNILRYLDGTSAIQSRYSYYM